MILTVITNQQDPRIGNTMIPLALVVRPNMNDILQLFQHYLYIHRQCLGDVTESGMDYSRGT